MARKGMMTAAEVRAQHTMKQKQDGSAKCSTCGRRADSPYRNLRAGEACVDPIHGPWATPTTEYGRKFSAFHGKQKAAKYRAYRGGK